MSCRNVLISFASPANLAGAVGLAVAGSVFAPAQSMPLGNHEGDLSSAQIRLAWLQSVAVFGRDDRVGLPKQYTNLSQRIGLLYNSRARTLCTAFCVAPNIVATAAHCVFRHTEFGAQSLNEFWFELRRGKRRTQARIAGAAQKAGMQNIIAGTTKLRVRPPIDAANDWALVRISKPVCKGKAIPVYGLSPSRLEKAAGAGRVFQVSYHRDYKHWELAYSQPCQVRRQYRELRRRQIRREFTNPDNLLLHRCDTAGASSGSPILLTTEKGPVAVGINVGTYVQSRKPVRNSRVARTAKSRTIANTGVSSFAFHSHISNLKRARVLTSHTSLAKLQVRLREIDLYTGPLDGIFGNMTRAAIQAYERSRGKPAIGLPTVDLLVQLGDPPPPPTRKPDRTLAGSYHEKTLSRLERLFDGAK